jgi:DNA-binding transcriptional LysR family regulator
MINPMTRMPRIHRGLFTSAFALFVASGLGLSLAPQAHAQDDESNGGGTELVLPPLPAPLPPEPSLFERGENAITHTFSDGSTIRPNIGYSNGTPTFGFTMHTH